MRVLGVHGVWNYRPGEAPVQAATALSSVWSTALDKRLMGYGLEVEVAYYADLLQRAGAQGAAISLDDLDEYELELVREWISALDPPEAIAAGPGTWPIRQAVTWVARTRHLGKAATERFVAQFFSEVASYLREPASETRTAVRARVVEALERNRPQILIAHSLGSVVAYEALWARQDLAVELLLTIGSPLAMPHAVFPRLEPSAGQGVPGRPPGAQRWVNLADPGDVIAIPPGGVSRSFSGVDVDRNTVIAAFDFHLVKNYLGSRQVADAVRNHTTRH